MHSYLRLISMSFLMLWYTPNPSLGFGSGAPSSRCGSMLPNHGFSSRPLPGPYRIVIAKETYIPFELVDVTIEAPSSQPFAGFLLQAVKADDNSINIGTFQPLTGTKNVCGQSGVTHTSGTLKDSLTFQWRAPTTGLADVVFRATVVQDYPIYYVDIRSDVLREAVSDTTTSSSITPTPSINISSSSSSQEVVTTSLQGISPAVSTTQKSSARNVATVITSAVSSHTSIMSSSGEVTSQTTTLPDIVTYSPSTTNPSIQTISSSMISISTLSHLTFSSQTGYASSSHSLARPTTSLSEATSSATDILGTQTSFSLTPTLTTSLSSTVGLPGGDANPNVGGTQDGDDSSEWDLKVVLMVASVAAWVLVVLIVAVIKCRRS